MKVILNSDVLFHAGSVVRDRLSRSLTELFDACRERGHEIVIPQTARLEFDRHQREAARSARQRLTAAYELLDSHGVTYSHQKPDTLIEEPDLIAIIGRSRVTVYEAEPTLDEFADAHRRASLHEAPHPPESKSDEMRDLVIWAQSLRLAAEDNGALLISRDRVHIHPRGDAEAGAAGLVRLQGVDDALQYFEVLTPAGRLLQGLAQAAWPALASVESDLPSELQLISVEDARFIQGRSGLGSAEARIRARAGEDHPLEAELRIALDGGLVTEARLTNVQIGDRTIRDVSAAPSVAAEDTSKNFDEALQRLRGVLGS